MYIFDSILHRPGSPDIGQAFGPLCIWAHWFFRWRNFGLSGESSTGPPWNSHEMMLLLWRKMMLNRMFDDDVEYIYIYSQ